MKVRIEKAFYTGTRIELFRFYLADAKKFKKNACLPIFIPLRIFLQIKKDGFYNIKAIKCPKGPWIAHRGPGTSSKILFTKKPCIEELICPLAKHRLRIEYGERYRLEVTKVRGKAT